MNKNVVLVLKILVIIALAIVLFIGAFKLSTSMFGSKEDLSNEVTNVSNNTINTVVDNEVENIVENEILNELSQNTTTVEKNETKTDVVQNTLVGKENVYDKNQEATATDKKQEAIELVKQTWGNDDSVTFSCDSVTSDGEYIIAVTSKKEARVLNYFRVNINTKIVQVDY